MLSRKTRTFKFFLIVGLFSVIALFSAFLKPSLVTGSYNLLRPIALNGGGNECLAKLQTEGVEYQHLGDIVEGACQAINAVKIDRFPNTMLNTSIRVSCPTALKLGDWFKAIDAKEISHLGTYYCRSIRGSSVRSEHGYGTAIDVTHIDGASVQKDWGDPTRKGSILRNAAERACDFFTNVLTPDFNAAHFNHFHLDNGFGSGCTVSKLIKKLTKRGN